MHIRRMFAGTAVIAFAVVGASCGDDDDGLDAGDIDLGDLGDLGELADEAEELQDFADAMNDATGAGDASGVLVFDGAEFPIESAICSRVDDSIDVGTVGANYRVFVSGDTSDPSLQILTPEGIQWFDRMAEDGSPPPVTFEGSTITAGEITWFNNQNDTEVTASFTIDCP